MQSAAQQGQAALADSSKLQACRQLFCCAELSLCLNREECTDMRHLLAVCVSRHVWHGALLGIVLGTNARAMCQIVSTDVRVSCLSQHV